MKHQKITNIFTVVLFVLPLALGLILFVVLPDSSFSEQENRPLQTFPKLSLTSLTEGKFGGQMNSYFADQFPARDALVGIKGVAELALGKGENNGVLLGKDGQLAVRWFDVLLDARTRVEDTDFYSKDLIDGQTDALNALAADLAAQNIPLTLIVPPRTVDVVGAQTRYPTETTNTFWQDLEAGLGSDVQYLDLTETFRSAYESGEYVYYRTDHHWTTKGAYMAYQGLMKKWGREQDVVSMSEDVETVQDFYGTTWSRAGFKFVAPDQIEIWHYEGENDYTVTNPQTGESFEGFYNREYLAKKDKYSVFLDGTHPILTVTKNTTEQRKTLLVLKDSFFNSMVPFLAEHYDLVVMDLSQGLRGTSLCDLIEQYGCDGVLIVYNAENIMISNSLSTLQYRVQK